MVSVFTGVGPGFERGSGADLGAGGIIGSGGQGRSGEQVSVNGATGNLIISKRDEFLVGHGPDAVVNRVYNSQGSVDHNGDQWRYGFNR
ncbi:MAG: hypothetical protein AAGK66_09705, partial [Pseudomonadota bacterium]